MEPNWLCNFALFSQLNICDLISKNFSKGFKIFITFISFLTLRVCHLNLKKNYQSSSHASVYGNCLFYAFRPHLHLFHEPFLIEIKSRFWQKSCFFIAKLRASNTISQFDFCKNYLTLIESQKCHILIILFDKTRKFSAECLVAAW